MIYSDQIPGKRFVFIRESAKKNIEVLESGYIRCCNVPFVKDNLGSIKLLLQYDGSNSFDVVNLTKVKSKILIEHILVEVSKDVQRIPALVFVSPFPKDNADTIYVQYFGSTEIKKVSKKKISPFKFKKEMRVTNSDNADLHDFADWLRIQKTKILLLLGPYELQSCRIDIYCLKSKCKKSGTLLSSDMLNKKVRFQDQQCDVFEVDSSLAQIKFNCSDEQLEQFMTGFAPKRSSRSSKKVNISKNPFIWNLPSWLSEQRYNNEYTSFFKHKNKSNVTSYKTTKSSETLINASSQSSLVSRKDCTDKVDKTTLKSTLNSLSLNSSSKSSLVSEKYSTDKVEKSISKSTLNSLSLSASSQSSLVSGKDSVNKVVDSMSKSALNSSSLNTSSKSSLVSGNDSTDKVDKTISKSTLNSLSLNVSSQASLVSRKDCTDKVDKTTLKSTLNSLSLSASSQSSLVSGKDSANKVVDSMSKSALSSSSLNTSSKSSLVSGNDSTDKVDKTISKSLLNSLSLNVSSQSSLVSRKDCTDKVEKSISKSTLNSSSLNTSSKSSLVSRKYCTDKVDKTTLKSTLNSLSLNVSSQSSLVLGKDSTDKGVNKSTVVETTPTSSVVSENNKTDIFTEPISKSIVVSNKDDTDNFMNKSVTNLNKDKQRPFSSDSGKKRLSITKYLVIKDMRQYITVDDDNQFFVGVEFDEISKQRIFSLESENKESNSIMQMNSFQVSTTSTHKKLNKSFQHRRISYQPFEVSEKCPYWKMPKGNFKLRRSASDGNMSISIACHSEENWQQKNHLEPSNLKGANNHSKGYNLEGINSQTVYNQTGKRKYLSRQQDIINVTTPNIYHELSLTHQSSTNNIQLLKDDTENTRLNQLSRQKNQKSDFNTAHIDFSRNKSLIKSVVTKSSQTEIPFEEITSNRTTTETQTDQQIGVSKCICDKVTRKTVAVETQTDEQLSFNRDPQSIISNKTSNIKLSGSGKLESNEEKQMNLMLRLTDAIKNRYIENVDKFCEDIKTFFKTTIDKKDCSCTSVATVSNIQTTLPNNDREGMTQSNSVTTENQFVSKTGDSMGNINTTVVPHHLSDSIIPSKSNSEDQVKRLTPDICQTAAIGKSKIMELQQYNESNKRNIVQEQINLNFSNYENMPSIFPKKESQIAPAKSFSKRLSTSHEKLNRSIDPQKNLQQSTIHEKQIFTIPTQNVLKQSKSVISTQTTPVSTQAVFNLNQHISQLKSPATLDSINKITSTQSFPSNQISQYDNNIQKSNKYWQNQQQQDYERVRAEDQNKLVVQNKINTTKVSKGTIMASKESISSNGINSVISSNSDVITMMECSRSPIILSSTESGNKKPEKKPRKSKSRSQSNLSDKTPKKKKSTQNVARRHNSSSILEGSNRIYDNNFLHQNVDPYYGFLPFPNLLADKLSNNDLYNMSSSANEYPFASPRSHGKSASNIATSTNEKYPNLHTLQTNSNLNLLKDSLPLLSSIDMYSFSASQTHQPDIPLYPTLDLPGDCNKSFVRSYLGEDPVTSLDFDNILPFENSRNSTVETRDQKISKNKLNSRIRPYNHILESQLQVSEPSEMLSPTGLCHPSLRMKNQSKVAKHQLKEAFSDSRSTSAIDKLNDFSLTGNMEKIPLAAKSSNKTPYTYHFPTVPPDLPVKSTSNLAVSSTITKILPPERMLHTLNSTVISSTKPIMHSAIISSSPFIKPAAKETHYSSPSANHTVVSLGNLTAKLPTKTIVDSTHTIQSMSAGHHQHSLCAPTKTRLSHPSGSFCFDSHPSTAEETLTKSVTVPASTSSNMTISVSNLINRILRTDVSSASSPSTFNVNSIKQISNSITNSYYSQVQPVSSMSSLCTSSSITDILPSSHKILLSKKQPVIMSSANTTNSLIQQPNQSINQSHIPIASCELKGDIDFEVKYSDSSSQIQLPSSSAETAGVRVVFPNVLTNDSILDTSKPIIQTNNILKPKSNKTIIKTKTKICRRGKFRKFIVIRDSISKYLKPNGIRKTIYVTDMDICLRKHVSSDHAEKAVKLIEDRYTFSSSDLNPPGKNLPNQESDKTFKGEERNTPKKLNENLSLITTNPEYNNLNSESEKHLACTTKTNVFSSISPSQISSMSTISCMELRSQNTLASPKEEKEKYIPATTVMTSHGQNLTKKLSFVPSSQHQNLFSENTFQKSPHSHYKPSTEYSQVNNAKPQSESIIYPRSPEFAYVSSQMQATTSQALTTPVSLRDIYNNRDICLNNTAPKDILASENIGVKELSRINDIFSYKNKTEVIRNHHQNVGHFINPNKTFSKGQNLQNTSRSENTFLNVTSALNLSTASITSHSILSSNHSQVRLNDHQRLEYPLPSVKSPVLSNRNLLTPLKNNEADISSHNTQVKLTKSVTYKPIKLSQSLPIATLVHIPSTNRRVSLSSHKIQPLTENQTKLLTLLNISTSTMEVIKKENNFKAAPYELQLKETENTNKAGTFSELQHKRFSTSILSPLSANTKSIHVSTMTKPTASVAVRPEQNKGFAGSILSPSSANTKSIQVLTMTKPTASVAVRPEQNKGFAGSILSLLPANTKSIQVLTMTKPTASIEVKPEQHKGFAGSILSPSSANTKSIQVLTMTKPTASVEVRPEQDKGLAASILTPSSAKTKSIHVSTMTKPNASVSVRPEQDKGLAASILTPSSAKTKSIHVSTMTKPNASVAVRPEQDKGLAASILTPSSAKTKSIHVSTMTKPNASVAVNVERLTTIVLKPNSKENFKYDQLKKFFAAPNNLSMLANQADLRRECSMSSNSGSILFTIPSHMITVPSSMLYNTEQKPSNVQRIHTSASSNVIMNASIKNAYSTKNKSSTHNHIDSKKVSVISTSKLLPFVPNSSFKDPESTITNMNTERKISSPNLIENEIKISPGLFDSIFPSSTIKNEVNQHIYHPAVKRKLDTPSQSPNYFNHAKESPQTFKPIKGTEPPSSKYPKLSSVITHTTKNLSILLDPVPNQRFQNLTNSRPFQRQSTSNVTPIITTSSFTPLNRISPLKVMVSDCFKPTTKTSQKLSETEKTTSIGITKKKKKNKKRRCWFPDKGEVDLGRVFGMFGSSSTSENMKKNNQKNKQQVEPLGQYKPAETVKLKKRKVCMTTGKHYLQSVACTDLQHLPMCIDCRDGGGNDDGSYCRFTMFRRLIQQEGGSPQVAGFCLPHEADDHDIEHWTYQHHEPTLDIESCIYIMQHIGMQFYQLVLQEVEAQSFRVSHDSSDVKWKRPVLQVREMCDICATTIFNIHWTCEQCGLGVCLDCFKSACNEKNSSKALDWPECDDDVDHDPVDLMVTQTIPKNVLADLLREMLMVCQKIDLKFFKLDILHSDKEKERASLKLLQDWNGLIAKQTGKPLHTEDHVDADRNIFESYNDLEFPSLPERCSWYCDSTMLHFNNPELNEDESKWFQSEWNKGKPIVVSNCHEKLDRSLWTPKAFGDDFGQEKNDIVNCYDGTLIEKFPVWQFWKGFESIEDRPVFTDQPTALLKLKDWPPGDDFKDKMPNRFADIMNGLPAPRYTKRTGVLNLASRLPAFFAVPDLGPKMYNAYGSASYPKSGTTNLHLDISDATNLMVYVGIPNDSEIGPNEVRDTFKIVDRACCSETQARIRKPGVLPGALWHIFPAHSAEKIRRFLRTVALERNITIKADSDPIHDQAYYLDQVLLDRLYREEGVKGYAICQCLGDAVFIPAGAPHQVLNLHSCIKVAEDFVAPEHIGHCFQLTQEFRRLSNYHTNHEDKLQIKNIIYHSVKDCLGVIKNHYGL